MSDRAATSYAWVSFADDLPLGVVFTELRDNEEGDSSLAAMIFVNRLHRTGCNPGGEVQWMSAPEAEWIKRSGEHWDWLLANADRVISPLELVESGYLALDDFGPGGRAMIERQLAEKATADGA